MKGYDIPATSKLKVQENKNSVLGVKNSNISEKINLRHLLLGGKEKSNSNGNGDRTDRSNNTHISKQNRISDKGHSVNSRGRSVSKNSENVDHAKNNRNTGQVQQSQTKQVSKIEQIQGDDLRSRSKSIPKSVSKLQSGKIFYF